MQLVAYLGGAELGVRVQTTKPTTRDEYIRAFRRLDSLDNNASLTHPRNEVEIQSGATYNLRIGSEFAEVHSIQDTGNFYKTVEAIKKPHDPKQD